MVVVNEVYISGGRVRFRYRVKVRVRVVTLTLTVYSLVFAMSFIVLR